MIFNEYFEKNFGIDRPGDVKWMHAVNNAERLDKALNNKEIMMIESDICISPNGLPIVAHNSNDENNLSYENLLNRVKESNKGIKLDIKHPEVLIPCLQILERTHFDKPIILNADILKGNHPEDSKFDPAAFISICNKFVPTAKLSLGWKTVSAPDFIYSQKTIDEMLKVAEKLEAVSFAIRACFLVKSQQNISSLIQQEGHTITIWNNETVEDELLYWIKTNTDPEKTFYDLIDENLDPVKLT